LIKINLAPIEELDSQFWFVPDAVVFLLVFAIAFGSVSYYLGNLETQIQTSYAAKKSMDANIKKLEPEVKRHTTLTEKKERLGVKRDSLKDITKVKLSRYLPVIVLEHIQNMKPMGLWFRNVNLTEQGKKISMQGSAMSNDLVAEYLKVLKATVNNPIDNTHRFEKDKKKKNIKKNKDKKKKS